MPRTNARLHDDGTFALAQYHRAAPFASFLPGIAGELGVPIWVFYCNRGQAITSCGVGNKDGAILEFNPADTAYQRVFSDGFRTFIWNGDHYYEPFRSTAAGAAGSHAGRRGHTQTMLVRAHELELVEENPAEGLRTTVVYFTLPNMPQGGLVRWVTVTNIGRRARTLRIADGVARLVPGCVKEGTYKNMSNTKAGMIETRGMAQGVVFSRSCVASSDTVTLDFATSGNCLVTQPLQGVRGAVRMLGDPRLVFGDGLDLSAPRAFIEQAGACRGTQREVGYMPCAFASFATTLAAGATCAWVSIVGHAASARAALQVRAQAARKHWVATKRAENAALIAHIQDRQWTVTSSPVFDHYCRQTYLDNVLRGGLPVSLGAQTFHLYFRRHGDMERDYNWFMLDPAYYSQGNASYRDINQNRRADVLFNPAVGLTNVRTFFNALQTDGNNPLTYEGTAFLVTQEDLQTCTVPDNAREALQQLVHQPVTPGRLAAFAVQHNLPVAPLLEHLLAHARRIDRFAGSDGFWSDHWTYCLDLLVNYLQVYPERAAVVTHERSYTYYDNPEVMVPRALRFTFDARSGAVRQHNALDHDAAKARLIAARTADATCVRTQHGTGEIYCGTLLEKLLCLVAIKCTALDPDGIGIELRGNRPGWNDALNGLPGLIGSSVNETAELLRLATATAAFAKTATSGAVFAELAELLHGIGAALAQTQEPLTRWNALNEVREQYLAATRVGLSGAMVTMTSQELADVLACIVTAVQDAMQRAQDARSGLYTGYYYYRVTAHENLRQADGTPVLRDGRPCVRPLAFERVALPAYLEPQVRVLPTLAPPAARRALHQAVRRSPLYDRTLQMFVLNASLAHTSKEIGRAGIFPPGWLENQSVWLHMEYKYLLALLQAGLYDEFFAASATALVPYQPPQRYGRSPLEHSSFIVSSAHPDKCIHGAGFYARLSGATIEFISMWLVLSGAAGMFAPSADGALHCALQPILPASFFTRRATPRVLHRAHGPETVTIPKDACAFVLLGGTLVVYHNPLRRDTFGPRGVTPQRYTLTDCRGSVHEITGGTIGTKQAQQIRAGAFARIDVELA